MEYIKLKDVCDFQGGSQPPKSEWINKATDGYIRMLQIRDFTQDREEKEFVKLTNTIKICKKDDVLIARYGASVGKILTGLEGAYNVAIMKSIPDENKINKKYLYYYFHTQYFQHNIKNVGSRAAQAGFNISELDKFNIYLAELDNQKKIVEVLDKAQSLIDKKKEQVELLDELVKSRFIDMFGDPVINNKNWETVELRYCIQEIKYGTSTPPNFSEQGIPFIRATNIKEGRIVENDMKYISDEEAKKIEKCKLSLGDTIIVRSGANTGDNTFVPEKYVDCYGGYDIIVKLNEKINYRFLNVLLNSVYREVVIQPLTRRAGQPHLNSEQIQSLMVYLPPIELQNEFAEFVTKTDSIRSKMEASLSELEDNFNSLMQKAFKGELF